MEPSVLQLNFDPPPPHLHHLASKLLPNLLRPPFHHQDRMPGLQEFEAEYKELWDWLMDMDAVVTGSHQLVMSDEQRHHLFKASELEVEDSSDCSVDFEADEDEKLFWDLVH
ncbi:hypothetical protein CRENBAI_021343 [Crenichthys baileyi]|uniref:Uncharacterized protein n=1 Tax=Crenichthys baileyi TaxID=28760 RepID=A0AAV9QSX1_9TELE